MLDHGGAHKSTAVCLPSSEVRPSGRKAPTLIRNCIGLLTTVPAPFGASVRGRHGTPFIEWDPPSSAFNRTRQAFKGGNRIFPVQAGIGDAATINEGCSGDQVLPPPQQIALHHHADNPLLSSLDL